MKRTVLLLVTMTAAVLLAGAVALVAPFGSGGLPLAEAQTSDGLGQQATLKGVLSVVRGDPRPGSGDERHRTKYLLTDERGTTTELLLAESKSKPLGGSLMLDHKRVSIQGAEAAGGRIRVDSIRYERSADAVTAATEEPQLGVSDSRRVVTVLCRFSDSTNVTPHEKPWFETLMGGTYPGMDHYWQETSYGNLNLAGSTVVGWYDLPHPRSHYIPPGGFINLQALLEDCTGAADAAAFFPDYTNINLMFNQALDCCAYGAPSSFLNRDGQLKAYGTAWLPPWAYESQFNLAHEMGHSFGLPHSSGPYNFEYDSAWDPMSSGCSPGHAEYGCIAVNTIAYHKDLLGWIPPERIYTVTSAPDQTITIDRLGAPASGSNYLLAKIPIGGSTTQFYTVEARRFVGYDEGLPGEAVVIHKVDTTLGDRNAQLVDADNNGDPGDAGVRWLPGETFTDPVGGTSVRVTGATTTGYTLTVNPSGQPPNDDFAGAQEIKGANTSASGTTSGATRETGEPDHSTGANGVGDHSVWYRWTASVSGSVTMDTCVANIDSILAVYTGASFDTLDEITSNHNGECPDGNPLGSKVTFGARAGTTYLIAVGDDGDLQQNGFALRLETTDTPPLTITRAPDPSFVGNSTLGTNGAVPISVKWLATGGAGGLLIHFDLQQSAYGSAYTDVPLPSSTATGVTRSLTPDGTYRFRVNAHDDAFNNSGWAYGSSCKVNAFQESSSAIRYAGAWTTQTSSTAYGGGLRYAGATGARAKLTFTGRSVAWVASKGANRGKAEVWIDGVKAKTLDLYSATAFSRRVVFSKSWSSPSSHTIEVRVLGAKNTLASGTRVDLDAFAVLS